MWWINPQEHIACTQLFYAVGDLGTVPRRRQLSFFVHKQNYDKRREVSEYS